MTVVVDRIKRIRAVAEATGSFATEVSIGSFTDIAAREDSVKLTLNRPMESPALMQQYLDAYPSKVFLPKDAQLDCTTNLRAATTRAASGSNMAATLIPDSPFFTAFFSGQFGGTGTTIATTSTTSVLNVTSATVLREGGAIACATGAGGALECREIKTIAANVVTLKHALSAIPANASVVYASMGYFLGNTDGTTPLSLQTTVEGLSTSDRWLLSGGQVKSAPSFEFSPGQIPKISWSWGFVQWFLANGVNTTMNLNAALADQNYSDAGINAVMDSEFRVFANGTTAIANTLLDAPQMTVTLGTKFGPHKTPGGVNTVKQWVRLRSDGPPVTGEFVIPHEATTWFDQRDAETERCISFQIGSSVANGAVLVTVPRVCIDDVQREEVDGIAMIRAKWYAKQDNTTTGNTTEQAKSPLRLHFF